jgi:AcrR family transcriptional regulator
VKNEEGVNARTERRDAAENRKRILEAAKKLFEQNGVDKVSMNQIAIEAGIGSGTLYRRYRNKSELCLDLKKDNIIHFFGDTEKYLEENIGETPEKRLKGILRMYISFWEKNIQILKEIEVGAKGERLNGIIQTPLYNKMYEIVVKLFNEMETNDSNEANNVFRADMLVFTILKSDSYIFQRDVRGYSIESFLEQLCLTFFPV